MTVCRAVAFALVFLFLAHPAAAQSRDGLHLELNIPTLELIVYEGDKVLRTYPVAVGKADHPTIEGDFTITHAEWNPWWRPPPGRAWTQGREITPPGPNNPMGRVKLFFEPLYFIHGTPEAESIGTPASHGCVRMRNADAIALGRLIHERAGATVPASELDRVLSQPRNTRHARFQNPVSLVIHYTPVVVRDGELRIYPDLYARRAIHAEGVYQALLAAGYDPASVDRAAVAEVIERSRRHKGTYRVKVQDAFGAAVVASRN